jgi:hypothetical protein
MKENILIITQMETEFKAIFPLAISLQKSEIFHPIIFFPHSGSTNPEFQSRMERSSEKECIQYILADNTSPLKQNTYRNFNTKTSEKKKMLSDLITIFRKVALFRKAILLLLNSKLYFYFNQFFRLIILSLKYPGQMKRVQQVMKNVKPRLIIVGYDGVGSNQLFIKTANHLKVPVLIIPLGYQIAYTTVIAIKYQIFNSKMVYGMENLFNRMIAQHYPKWVYSNNEKILHEPVLKEPVSTILFQELFNLAPPLPWSILGGSADFAAVESEAMYNHYVYEGIDPKKMVLTGSAFDDELFDNLNHVKDNLIKLYANLGLPQNKPMIVCALPPDQSGSITNSEFNDHYELLNFYIEVMNEITTHNVIFQGHPRVTDEQFEYIRSKNGCVTRLSITELIPLCDLLVSDYSSIMRMAIACGKPVLCYDVFRYGAKICYESAEGVIVVEKKEDFKQYLNKLLSDQQFFNEMSALQKKCAKKWGILDGQSQNRILRLIKNIT